MPHTHTPLTNYNEIPKDSGIMEVLPGSESSSLLACGVRSLPD